jgi:hypothetical protein
MTSEIKHDIPFYHYILRVISDFLVTSLLDEMCRKVVREEENLALVVSSVTPLYALITFHCITRDEHDEG